MLQPIKSNFKIKFICIYFLGALFIQSISAQPKTHYNDGPYIDIAGDTIILKWIEKGLPRDTIVLKSQGFVFDKPNLPKVDLNDLEISQDDKGEYQNIEKFIVISDLHGQFDPMMSLLKAHKVIDSLGNWIFDNYHLVIAGDHFSRGDKVLEILWFLFKLEKQADKAGGKVQVMLGNHELMTLNNDLRYLNVKYSYTSGVLQTQYYNFFSDKSVLGNWLRAKNVVVTLNDNLIVHGGLSQKIVDANLSTDDINSFFRDSILKSTAKVLVESPTAELLLGDDGPLWYRGYADTLTYHEDSLKSILNFYNVNSVVVGHTIMSEITPRFNGKLFLIDCGMITGKPGEVLIWENNSFFRGKANGKQTELNKASQNTKKSLFETIYNMHGDNPKLRISTDFKKLIKNKLKEEEQESTFELKTVNDSTLISLTAKVRARGNMRKQVCYYPPVKFNFVKKDLSQYNLKSTDKIKMVFPCRDGKSHQEKLMQEYFLYTLYQIIDSNSVRAKLLDIEILNEKREISQDFIGFIVEDEDAYALRTGAKIVPESAKLNSTGLEREPFLLMYLFQYMIANTDWSVGNRHNVMIVKLPQYSRTVALPYDFDYSGFVDQSYAVPDNSLPIKSVSQRHFMPYVISKKEFDIAVTHFQEKKQTILAACDNAKYLNASQIERNKSFLLDFYKELDQPEKLFKLIKTK
jgi:hypothetical protein